MLGPVRVLDGDEPLDLGGPRQRDVLAVLLAAVPDEVSADRLIDEVWGENPPNTASHVIRTYISNLRVVLGDRIVSDGQHYRLAIEEDDTDVAELSGSLVAARAMIDIDPLAAFDELTHATSVRRGRPFEDSGEEATLVRARANGLEEEHLRAMELRFDAALQLGRHSEVIPQLAFIVDRFPFREHLTAQLMLALYRSGRQADALRAYSALRTRLAEDLGVDPSPQLQLLEEQVLQQDPALELGPPHNVPVPVSSFIGRAVEIGEIQKQLRARRLVTLVGPGGVGKTRLAREAALSLLADFPDGVFWVDLAPLREADAVVRQAAEILGLGGQQGQALIDVVGRYLSRREALLVFDNCEHLSEAVGRAVSSLLEVAPDVKVLATSRRPLDAVGEVRFQVPAMELPDRSHPGSLPGSSDAERLFMVRAADRSGPMFGEDGRADQVAEICLRLDGIPLAIEMAAARTDALTPSQILERLDAWSDFLVAPEVNRDERQRTLEATIDWSYDLLDPAAQAVFRRISVFRGSFDLEAAEAVAGFGRVTGDSVFRAINALVSASLLTTVRGGGQMRYQMLVTIRDYGQRRLVGSAELIDVETRHARHHLSLAAAAGSLRMTPGFTDAMPGLEAANDDLVSALDWALENEPELTVAAAGGLCEYWSRGGDAPSAYRYGRAMLDLPFEMSAETRANVLLLASFGAALSGDFELATAGPVEAMDLAEDSAGWQTRLWARHARGQIATIVGDLETVGEMGKSILEVCEEEGLELPRAYGSSLLGQAEFFADRDYEIALRYLDEAIEGMRALGDYGGMKAYGLVTAGTAAALLGDYRASERYAAEAISIPGALAWTAMAYITLGGYTLHPKGDLDRALVVLERGTRLAYETSTEIWVRTGLLFLARLASDRHDWELSAKLFGACRPNLPAWGRQDRWWGPERDVRRALGDEVFDRLRRFGETAELEVVIGWID